MFSIRSRLKSLLRLRITLTIFILILAAFAITNFFILLSLKTDAHDRPEGLLESLFLIHIHSNVSVVRRDEQKPPVISDLDKTKAPEIHIERGRRVVSPTNSIKTPERIQHATSIKVNEKVIKKSTKRRVKTTQRTDLSRCAAWCRRGDGLKPPYLLTAVLLVRIYRHDLAKLTSREMIQWLQYLRYAGFQHVYVYDAYVKPSESQRDVIEPFVQSGYATYIDWSIHNPYTIQGTQVAAYQDCIDKFGKDSKWQAAIDIDEYPFSPDDVDENFMSRFLAVFPRDNPEVSEITMKNYLFLGKPIDDASEPLLMARIRRRTHEPANALVKPIYKPANIAWAQVHHNGVRTGMSRDSQAHMLRMNHYWGARLQDWGEDTPKVLDMTEPDYTIEPIVRRVKQCASCLGHDRLYVKRWA